jgi:hypothetical protein
VLDPFAHDVERDHRYGDAIVLNYQTGRASRRSRERLPERPSRLS